MRLNWKKWGLEFWKSLARHIGTAGATWQLGDTFINGASQLDALRKLPMALLCGAILPTIWTFLQSTPAPDDEDGADAAVKPVEPKGP